MGRLFGIAVWAMSLLSGAIPSVEATDPTPPGGDGRTGAGDGGRSSASPLDRRALESLLVAFDVPGLALATLAGCELEHIETLGVADLDEGTPVGRDTAFEAASLSKPVFAYLVMQLVDEGAIDLDAPLVDGLEYPRITDRDAYRLITPRMVLSHRTGLPNWVGDTDDADRDDPIAFDAPPGAAFSYSGEAFELLRAYVEERTGRSLATLFDERLGEAMPSSTFAPPLPADAVPSRGYRSASDAEGGRALDTGGGGAAGGLVTTIDDYARFVGAVCRGDGLSPEAAEEMLTPRSPVPSGDAPAPTSWGLGWSILSTGAGPIVLHDGDNGEYRTLAAFLPETGEGYVFLTNGANGAELIGAIIERLERAAGQPSTSSR